MGESRTWEEVRAELFGPADEAEIRWHVAKVTRKKLLTIRDKCPDCNGRRVWRFWLPFSWAGFLRRVCLTHGEVLTHFDISRGAAVRMLWAYVEEPDGEG